MALLLASCGDDGTVKPSIDAAPLAPGIKVSGQVVRAPGQPVPIADVTVSVIDPVEDPENLIQAKTDDHGVFVLDDVHPTSGGRVRLFIDGTTGGGGPFVVMNAEFPIMANKDQSIGVVHLVPMDPAGIVRITPDNATIVHMGDGHTYAKLNTDVAVTAGTVPSTETPLGRSAQLTVPMGTVLVFPYASPLLVNVTRVDLSAIPAPLPRASDGPRYTNYFVTLQPSGLQLTDMSGTAAPVGLQLPEIDPWPDPPGDLNQVVEFWEVDTSTETFNKVAMGTVQEIPGVGHMAVSDMAFVSRFGWYAATPPCPSGLTTVQGKAVDAGGAPVAGATIRTQGLRATSGNDGTFSIPMVPLGCITTTPPQVEVLASLQRNDGTFLSGSSGSITSVPGGTTDVGNVLLTTPLYVVRAQPSSAFGVSVDTVLDVFFSEAIDPATLTPATTGIPSVLMQSISIINEGTCTVSRSNLTGTALLDAADPKHVQFVPSTPLNPGQNYAGFVTSSVIKSVAAHTMPQDFSTPFSTVDTQPPGASLLQPPENGAFIRDRTINFTGDANDTVGIARAKFQLFASDTTGTMGNMVGEFPAAIINADPCQPNRLVHLRAAVPLMFPNGFYLARVVVTDQSGNQSQSIRGETDHLIQLVDQGAAFPFCGQAVTTAYVSSNGYITFDTGDTSYDPSVTEFFAHSRVSAFYTDLDFRPVGQNGTVFWNVDTSDASDPAFVVTWLNAGMYSSQVANDTVQVSLFKSGAIQIAYGGITDVRASTSGSQAEDMFMGVSCPGTPTTPAPPRTNLLTTPYQMGSGHDVTPWNGEPVYDFLSRPDLQNPTPPSSLFPSRYFNFLPAGVATKPMLPIQTGGHVIATILGDDLFEAVPITFTGQPQIDAGTPDAGTPDAAVTPDAGVQNCTFVNVNTIAGTGAVGMMNGAPNQATFSSPAGVASDTSGNIFVADEGNHAIRVVSAAGAVSTIAGTGTAGFFDGSTAPTSPNPALFNSPGGVALNSSGVVFVADTLNNRIRTVIPGQMIAGTLAGNGQTSPFMDGSGGPTGTTTFNGPASVAFDATTNSVIVADTGNHRIRQVSAAGGATSTLAGNGVQGFLDTSALNAEFSAPLGVAVDASGTVYVADSGNLRIRKIAGGQVTTLAGNGNNASVDGTGGPSGTASFMQPRGIVAGIFMGQPVVYVAEIPTGKIRMINLSNGQVSTIAGSTNGFNEGPGCGAQFFQPAGLGFRSLSASANAIYVGDFSNERVRQIATP
jgi:sugar lactone lactonase YvrE